MSACYSSRKWNSLPVLLLYQGAWWEVISGTFSSTLADWVASLLEDAVSYLISTLQRDCLDMIQRNCFLMYESLMALIQPPLPFTGCGTCPHSQSFRFRKDLAALACKDGICCVQNQVPGAGSPLLSCTSIPICELLAACVSTKGGLNIHQEGYCFPQGSRRYGPLNEPPCPPLPTLPPGFHSSRHRWC